MQELGVGFVSATEPIETATPMGKAFLGILAVLAQLEREQISQRVTDALAYKRSQGKLLGTLPVGFVRNSDGAMGVDRKAASVIRLIFEQYASGAFSFRTLAAWLNGRGIKPIATRGGNGQPPARLWSGDVLKEILKRPSYAGLVLGPNGLDNTPRSSYSRPGTAARICGFGTGSCPKACARAIGPRHSH